MNWLPLLMIGIAAPLLGQPAADWALDNFAQRLEVEVSNPSSKPVDTIAVIPVAQAAQVASRFPGTLAIVVVPGKLVTVLPSQADDIDGDGVPDEFVFPVRLAAGETRTVHIYYSTTLADSLPWPKRVHASHAFGYNHATVALESEVIGYRTYGGFFLDIQARAEGRPGLNNSLVGYLGTGPSEAGRDIIHLGDTLGLGGLFLQSGTLVFRPPVNMPDYAHKPEIPGAPRYRVIADGPIRAIVEARIERWKIDEDEADIRALYSITAGSASVECRFEIKAVHLSRSYEVGAGIRHLPQMKTDHAPGRLALSGQQSPQIGPLAMALYYDAADAVPSEPIATKDDKNECVVFRRQLDPGAGVSGRYWVSAAWSGSGIKNLLGYLAGEEARARATVKLDAFRFAKTPAPERVEGEAR
jgi:hypothetical protein